MSITNTPNVAEDRQVVKDSPGVAWLTPLPGHERQGGLFYTRKTEWFFPQCVGHHLNYSQTWWPLNILFYHHLINTFFFGHFWRQSRSEAQYWWKCNTSTPPGNCKTHLRIKSILQYIFTVLELWYVQHIWKKRLFALPLKCNIFLKDFQTLNSLFTTSLLTTFWLVLFYCYLHQV